LASDLITENSQSFSKLQTINVSWQFHATKTSSRTKWSRMTFGVGIVSSK